MDLELQLAKPLTVCKTLVLPVDDRITKTKVKFLDRLTARLTYGVQLFLEKIIPVNSGLTVLVFFIVSQLYILSRVWIRLSFFGGQYLFYHQTNMATQGINQ